MSLFPTGLLPTVLGGGQPAEPRISQILPTVKCSTCGVDIPLNSLADHICRPAKSQPPSPSAAASRFRGQDSFLNDYPALREKLMRVKTPDQESDRGRERTQGAVPMRMRSKSQPRLPPSSSRSQPLRDAITNDRPRLPRILTESNENTPRKPQPQLRSAVERSQPPAWTARDRLGRQPPPPNIRVPPADDDELQPPRPFRPNSPTGSVTSSRSVPNPGRAYMGRPSLEERPRRRPSIESARTIAYGARQPPPTSASRTGRPPPATAGLPPEVRVASPPRQNNGGNGGNMAGVGRRGFAAAADAVVATSAMRRGAQNSDRDRSMAGGPSGQGGQGTLQQRRGNAGNYLATNTGFSLGGSTPPLSPALSSPSSPSLNSPVSPIRSGADPYIASSRTPSSESSTTPSYVTKLASTTVRPPPPPPKVTTESTSAEATPRASKDGDETSPSGNTLYDTYMKVAAKLPSVSAFTAMVSTKKEDGSATGPTSDKESVSGSSKSSKWNDGDSTMLAYGRDRESNATASQFGDKISFPKSGSSKASSSPKASRPSLVSRSDSSASSQYSTSTRPPARSAPSRDAASNFNRDTALEALAELSEPSTPLPPPKVPKRAQTTSIVSSAPRTGRPRSKSTVERPMSVKIKYCVKCDKVIENGRWVKNEGGGVLCENCWKSLYLPRCRRCDLPIEKGAVSSSDGQLKGKYHKDCFTCMTCDEPFPNKEFYVFDNNPYCEYHYHKVNKSLCAAPYCGKPIEGPCAIAHNGDRYHPNCFLCEWRDGECDEMLSAEYWEIDGRKYCEFHGARADEETKRNIKDKDERDRLNDFTIGRKLTMTMGDTTGLGRNPSGRTPRAMKRITRLINLAAAGYAPRGDGMIVPPPPPPVDAGTRKRDMAKRRTGVIGFEGLGSISYATGGVSVGAGDRRTGSVRRL